MKIIHHFLVIICMQVRTSVNLLYVSMCLRIFACVIMCSEIPLSIRHSAILRRELVTKGSAYYGGKGVMEVGVPLYGRWRYTSW